MTMDRNTLIGMLYAEIDRLRADKAELVEVLAAIVANSDRQQALGHLRVPEVQELRDRAVAVLAKATGGPYMTDDPAVIAASLTEAQRDAMLRVFSWQSPMDQDAGEAGLIKLRLWASYGRNGQEHLTPLGLAVRAHILKGHP